MVILTNPELLTAIQNSYSLQQFLSPHQIKTFIKKSFELSQEKQEKLLQKLKEEEKEIQQTTIDNAEKLKNYNSKIKTIIQQWKQEENKKQRERDNVYIEHLLQEL